MVKLQIEKLLGFRIAGVACTAVIGPKDGTKMGVKIGTKGGVKAGTKGGGVGVRPV